MGKSVAPLADSSVSWWTPDYEVQPSVVLSSPLEGLKPQLSSTAEISPPSKGPALERLGQSYHM